MDYFDTTKYTVTELTEGVITPNVKLCEHFLNGFLNRLLEELASPKRGGRLFRVTWKGSNRVPMTVVGEFLIDWTQSGIVADPDGEIIGYYERIKDVQGPEQENEMLIVVREPPIWNLTMEDESATTN